MTITFNNPESLSNSYPLIIIDTTTIGNNITLAQQSITDYGALDVPYVQSIAYSSPGIPVSTILSQRNIRVQVSYQAPGGGAANVILKTVHIKYRHRFYVITSTASTVSSIQDLLDNATSTITSTLLVDPSKAVQSLQVQCNNNTENNSTFTWILIPGSGTLGEVAAEVIGKGVANYTDSWTLYDNSGSGFARTVGTAAPTYKAYRSILVGHWVRHIPIQAFCPTSVSYMPGRAVVELPDYKLDTFIFRQPIINQVVSTLS